MIWVRAIVGAIPGALGWWLFRRGRRHRVCVGHPSGDIRKPILYLRSFKQDGLQAAEPETMKGSWAATITGGRFEDMIRHAFRRIGPLLAIVVGMGIDPMLELIDRCDPRQDANDAFQLLSLGTRRISFIVERAHVIQRQ